MTAADRMAFVTIIDGEGDSAQERQWRAAVGVALRRCGRPADCVSIVRAPGAAPVSVLLESTRASWLVFVPLHHRLRPDAVVGIEATIGAGAPDAFCGDGFYGDVIEVDPTGLPVGLRAQPAWAPEWWRCGDLADSVVVVRRATIAAHASELTTGAEVYDLGLRLIEQGSSLGHLPAALSEGAPARRSSTAAHEALTAHLGRCAIDGDVTVTGRVQRIRRRGAEGGSVSVVIPTRGSTGVVWGAQRCFVVDAVRSLAEHSTHRDTEVVVVADHDTPAAVLEALAAIQGLPVRIVEWALPFSFSGKINAGCAAADGDLLLLLNDDTELIEPDSISEMVGYFTDTEPRGGQAVGMVGAQLLYDDGTLQHAGHVYNEHVLHAFPGWAPGSHPLLTHPRECSGVTAAAAMVDRGTFEAVGGFPTDFPLDFNDVDFSLNVRAAGRRVIWTPHASWHHFEGRTRGRGPTTAEVDRLMAKWQHEVDHDPYYHPRLERRRADWMPLPGWGDASWPRRARTAPELPQLRWPSTGKRG